jgi:glycosylphosphatidylinositol transamidase
MPPIILFSCALIFQSLVLYYLGSKPVQLPSENKDAIPPAYSLQKRHTMFAFSILTITHVTGIIIFNLMQPTFGWRYLAQFEENQVSFLCEYISK